MNKERERQLRREIRIWSKRKRNPAKVAVAKKALQQMKEEKAAR